MGVLDHVFVRVVLAYWCPQCAKTVEVFDPQKLEDEAYLVCPFCGNRAKWSKSGAVQA
jgi:DNA-directed RNA polymerase subunit RPC12/RpoP